MSNDDFRGGEKTGEAAAAVKPADLFKHSLAIHPDELEAEPKRFGVGRPKGSKNRSSEDLARMVQQIGGHPVLAMARIAGMSIEQIKALAGCSRTEAFDRWVNVLDKLAPYVASKMPLAVTMNSKVVGLQLTVPLGDGSSVAGPGGIAALFDQARERAKSEGFAVVDVTPTDTEEDATETET